MTGVIRNVFSCRGNWKGCSERRRSGKQERSCPGAVAALVEHAIVEPVRIARPELDAIGHETIAAPERRGRDRRARRGICRRPPPPPPPPPPRGQTVPPPPP